MTMSISLQEKILYSKLYTIKQKGSKKKTKSWEIKAKPKNMTAK